MLQFYYKNFMRGKSGFCICLTIRKALDITFGYLKVSRLRLVYHVILPCDSHLVGSKIQTNVISEPDYSALFYNN